MSRKVTCPYCFKPAKLVGGDAIYKNRPDLIEQKFYQCIPCGAYVGCHPDTIRPLGTLANAQLRRARTAAHRILDPLWNKIGAKKRTEVYGWLAEQMGIEKKYCHIGKFSVEDCLKVIEICKRKHRGSANCPINR